MIVPIIDRILIKPFELAEANETYKKMKEIGLALPQHNDTRREEKAVELGTIIAIGDTAFAWSSSETKPQIGDTVSFVKYSGQHIRDTDGTEYQLILDTDITAIIKE